MVNMTPMPPECVAGGGRDPTFAIPQYFVEVAGLRTAIADSGGDGPVLVFVHGLAGNLTHFVHVAHRFVDRFRVVALDLPGCGESARTARPYTVHGYAEHLASLLDVLGVESATWVGHSLGGMVVTQLALLHPRRVESVVLVDPGGFLSIPAPLRWLGGAVLREPVLSAVLPRIWKRLLDQVFAHETHTTRQFVRVQEQTYDPDVDIHDVARVIADLRSDFLYRNFLPVLSELTVPVAVIWGADDRLVPARALQRAAMHLPDPLLLELPGVGHMPIIEAPHSVVQFLEHVLSVGAARRRAA